MGRHKDFVWKKWNVTKKFEIIVAIIISIIIIVLIAWIIYSLMGWFSEVTSLTVTENSIDFAYLFDMLEHVSGGNMLIMLLILTMPISAIMFLKIAAFGGFDRGDYAL